MNVAEKAEILTKKRNMEGNQTISTFSVLDNVELINKSVNMGVKVNIDDMKPFDIIKDLELSRHALENKNKLNNKGGEENATDDTTSVGQMLLEW